MMNAETLRPNGDMTDRNRALLSAIEDHMYHLSKLTADSSSWRPTKLTRNQLLLLVTEMEVLRIMASTGAPEHVAREEACLRFDSPEAMVQVREYVAEWDRRAEETRR